MATQLPPPLGPYRQGCRNSGSGGQRGTIDLRIPAIEKYAYCLCLHVKPTTIFIAVFKLIRALLFTTMIVNNETSLAVDQTNEHSYMSGLDEKHRSAAAAMTIFSKIILASVSAVGIYAVVSGRAALLMPLYAMLLVDFFFALPAIYNQDLNSQFSDGLHPGDFARAHNSMQPGIPQHNRYTLILIPIIAILVRMYFLCVVWKCYRYLRLIELVTPIRLSEIYPHIPPIGPQYPIVRVLGSIDSTDLSSGQNVTPPPYDSIASTMKPPNYEEAMKSSGSIAINNSEAAAVSAAIAASQQQQQQQSNQTLRDQQPVAVQAQNTVVFTIPTTDQHAQNITTQVAEQAAGSTTAATAIAANPVQDANPTTLSNNNTNNNNNNISSNDNISSHQPGTS